MQETMGMWKGEKQFLGERPLLIGASENVRGRLMRDKARVSEKHINLGNVVPVEDYIDCVVEARKMMLDDGPTKDFEALLAIPDTYKARSESEYSQDKHAIDEDEYSACLNSGSNRSSSGGDALCVALMRFCAQHGL